MRALIILSALIVSGSSYAVDFFADHDHLFRDQSLCDAGVGQQSFHNGKFKSMYASLKSSELNGAPVKTEVTGYGVYSTELKNLETGERCGIIRHDDCFSAYCDNPAKR